MCNFRLEKSKFENKYQIQFDTYFSEALNNLKSLEADKLIILGKEELKVTDIGRLLIRKA